MARGNHIHGYSAPDGATNTRKGAPAAGEGDLQAYQPSLAAPIPDEVVIAALDTVLKPLGTNLRHYMPVSKQAAIEAMRGVLTAVRTGQ